MKKSIVQWCKSLHEAGNELTLKWEGGGDSGWVYFEIDGESADNEYTRALIDKMDNTLDYGSWAGEFQANGKAIYDAPTRTFEGTDYYGEDGNDVIDSNIVINIPKRLWFDTLHVEVECNYDETPNISVQFLIKNGFLTQEHLDICSNLEEILRDDFEALFSNYETNDNCDFRGSNDSFILERKDGIEDEDMLVFKINKIEVNTIDSEERTIVFKLDDDIIKAIDEKLNQTEDAN
jgi:hypothetical protein